MTVLITTHHIEEADAVCDRIAIYPISIMPNWLTVLSTVNPLTYIVNLRRGFLVTGHAASPVTDFAVLIVALVVTQVIAGKTYQRIMI